MAFAAPVAAFAAPVAAKLWLTAAEMIEQRAAQQRQMASEARANATDEAEARAAEDAEREAIAHHVWALDKRVEAAEALTALLEAEAAASAEQNRTLEAQIKSGASPAKENVEGSELVVDVKADSNPGTAEGERTKSRTRGLLAFSKIASPTKSRNSHEASSPLASPVTAV